MNTVQGFMGLIVHPGKTYTQIVSAPFRIAMASLGEDVTDEKRTTVTVVVDKKEYVLCTLIANKIEQQALDITFVEGEEITFAVKGDNIVHLTGNYVFSDDEEEMGSEMESEDDESFDEEEFMKNLPEGVTPEEVRALLAQQDMSGSEIESDEEIESEEEEEEEEEEEVPVVVNKKRAAEPVKEETPTKKQKAEAKKAEAKKVEAKKAEAKKVEEPKKKEAKKVEAKKEEAKKVEEPKKEEPKKKEAKKVEEKKKITKLPNGLIIEDVKVGEGASCKSGQRVGMRYIGKLTSGKVFDKNVSGKPFSFLLGRGEVIKGWDIGVAGMKAGGERKLTIPAPLAYGKRGAPPDIPKNATLVFDIKLVSMK
ncbi:hypothetical protein INT47_001563 [Mucor saturninus]|uniref:FK506-binding protein n=1 Tax=Mucor saturninus TaxID=64648 RepID=A0A8H7QXI0_9FUNG|nr:hypothetical protein INT47_001563 [Mucor saturninus]